MEIIHFQAAIEIQSLYVQIESCNGNISSEQKRVEDIKDAISNKELEKSKMGIELEQSNSTLNSNEKDIFDTEKNLEQAKSHYNDAKNKQQADALEKEINVLSKKVEVFELSAYEQMELIECYKNDLSELSNFIEGASKSLNEINSEVELNISEKNREIKNFNLRITNLFETMPKSFEKLITPLFNKYKGKSIASINEGSCSKCAYSINRATEIQVEQRFEIEFCPGCRRILIPKKALP